MGDFPKISDAELSVMEILWDLGSATVREVHDQTEDSRAWAYTTVQTYLQRLEAKGFVKARKGEGNANVYRPMSRERFVDAGLGEMVDRVCGGSAAPLVVSLVRGHDFEASDIARFRELLDELEADGAADSSKKRRAKKKKRGRRS